MIYHLSIIILVELMTTIITIIITITIMILIVILNQGPMQRLHNPEQHRKIHRV